MRNILVRVIFAVALAVPSFSAAPSSQKSASDDVSTDHMNGAKRLAEASPLLKHSHTKTVFVGVDIVREKGSDAEYGKTLYRVRHYRYDDDTAVTTIIDLERDALVQQIEDRHGPIALSVGEYDEARRLALSDTAVARALGSYKGNLTVEPLVVRTSAPADAWFGKRIVRLLFRINADYLTQPTVFVDLTEGKVIVEQHDHSSGDSR